MGFGDFVGDVVGGAKDFAGGVAEGAQNFAGGAVNGAQQFASDPIGTITAPFGGGDPSVVEAFLSFITYDAESQLVTRRTGLGTLGRGDALI